MSNKTTQDFNRQFIVTELPKDKLSTNHFTMQEVEVPEPGPDEILIRTLYLSLDPAARAWMQGRTYRDPVQPGMVMPGFILAEVVASNDPDFVPGELVESHSGWQDYAVLKAGDLYKLPWREPVTHYMSVLGVTGKTAYFGMLDLGQPKPGETVVVSAAAGAVGSVAGQIAKIKGARVVGIAGSEEKCAWLIDELGFDAAVNYKTGAILKAIAAQCPSGIDVYFDNVGGDILEACLFLMNERGRIVCCGALAYYDGVPPTAGPRGIPGLVVTKRLRMEGFIVLDFYDRRRQAEDELATWVAEGRLKVCEDIIEGLENAPQGLVGLLAGQNMGKRIIKVA